MDKASYSLIEQLNIKCGDPISALNMNNRAVIIGTAMGKILMLNLSDNIITKLSNASDEHISSISFEDNDVFSIGVGDEFVLRYHDYTSMNCLTMNNYKNEMEHSSKCQTSYSIISGPKLFLINLAYLLDGSIAVSSVDCDYITKNLITKDIKAGKLPMTNYSIPFDFDGNNFLWIEYHNEKKSNICVADCSLESPNVWKYALPNGFGRISHAKLISDQKLFIVRNMNCCEIRHKDKAFTLEQCFINIGEEVIATSFSYHNNYTFPTCINQVIIHENKEDKYMKLNTNAHMNNNNSDTNTHPNPNTNTNKQKETEPNMTEEQKLQKSTDLSIILLDINGNVNVYENKQISTRFNLNNVPNIPKDQKDKQFFTMGYPYYIKANNEVYSISCDHGCYVISNKKLVS